MRTLIIHSSALLLVFSALGSTLEVAPDSSCASLCIDDTTKGNVTDRESSGTYSCYDKKYAEDAVGKKFAGCNGCMQNSGYQRTTPDWEEKDITWFMFNNRAAVEWCLFGHFDSHDLDGDVNTTLPYQKCNSKCVGIKSALDDGVWSSAEKFDWCEFEGGDFTKDAESCADCLYNTPTLTILGNMLTGLQELCHERPIKTFTFSADIYAPTRIAQVATPSSSSYTASSPTALPSDGVSKNSKISVGAIAGIAIAGLAFIILILCAILLVLRRLKLKNKTLVKSKEAESDLGNYHELSAPAGGYSNASSPGASKYAHTVPLGGYGHESASAELGWWRSCRWVR